VEKLHSETSKRRPESTSAKGPLVWALRFLRFLFNLVLILIVGMLVVVSSLYAYVLYIHEDQLERKYPDLVKNSSVYDNVGHTTRLSTAVPIGYPGPASLCSTFKCLGGLR
jgi:hypothetical protein